MLQHTTFRTGTFLLLLLLAGLSLPTCAQVHGPLPFIRLLPDTLPTPLSLSNQLPDSLKVPSPDSVATKKRLVLFDSASYRIRGDGNFSRGNINRSLMILRTELVFAGPVVTVMTNPRFTYGEQKNVLAERELYTDLFIDIHEERKVYGFGLGILERSNLRAIDVRKMGGLGFGWRLFQGKQNSLSLTNAIIYESTRFRSRPDVTTTRNSLRIKGIHHFSKSKLRFNHLTFIQPSITNLANLRWNTILSLEAPVSKWVSLRTSFENSYESIVEAGRKKNDSRLTVGFAVGNR
jgi:hypothetical protein